MNRHLGWCLMVALGVLFSGQLAAGQIMPKGKAAQHLIRMLKEKDLVGLQKMLFPDYVNFEVYESQEFWTPKMGSFESSEVAKLLFDDSFFQKRYRSSPPDSTMPESTWQSVLSKDFYAIDFYPKKKSTNAKIYKGQKLYPASLHIYHRSIVYEMGLLCSSQDECFVRHFYISGNGDEQLFWTKACSTDKDMYGKPMKKTMCPDH